MRDRIRWGLHATGHVAAKVIADLQLVPDAEVRVIVSRHLESARAFARMHAVPHACSDPAAVVGKVDVVHVTCPAAHHAEVALSYLALGVPVLVEKPFATSADDARRIIIAARQAGVFAMEAMWMRFLPGILEIADLVRAGDLGVPQSLQAAFGRPGPFPSGHRLRRPDLGGGALLDMGVYPLSLAHLLFGVPSEVWASWVRGSGDVDDITTAVLTYPDVRALAHSSIAGPAVNAALISGSDGHIVLPADFIAARGATVVTGGRLRLRSWPRAGFGYQFQALEVQRCLRAGLPESPMLPLQATLEVMEIVDMVASRASLVD